MTAPASRRILRPRVTAEIPVTPVTFTDLTSPVVTGLEARALRELLIRERIPHVRVGHRVIVRVDVYLAALERIASRGEATEEPTTTRSPRANRVLALIGRERAS